MCSGCSGDYAGGFDSDDFDELIGEAGDNALSASPSGTSDAALEESDWGETGLAQRRGGGFGDSEFPETAWEACEILVTETQIVEIRVIAANAQRNSAKDSANDRLGKMRAALAWPPRGKHSSAESAKYYQTRHGNENAPGYAARLLRISRSWTQSLAQRFAGACRAKLEKWARRTRRLVQRCTAQTT